MIAADLFAIKTETLLKLITVINLDIGNIASVSWALNYLGVPYKVTSNYKDIPRAEKIIFPGVGNFREAVRRLNQLGIMEPLKETVLGEQIPILGICLGMQLFASYGEEGGGAEGLDFIKGRIVYHRASKLGLCLPHIGWNNISFNEDFTLFSTIKNNAHFYFIHSFEMTVEEKIKKATCNYGVDFIAAIQKKNIMGVQFHPEKSQQAGIKLLDNFCKGIF